MSQPARFLGPRVAREPNELVARVAYVDHFLNAAECARAIREAEGGPAFDGLTGPEGKRDQARESTVHFLWPGPAQDWLFDKLEYAVRRLNEGYGFTLSGFFEGAQVAAYSQAGHYDWHIDLGEEYYSNRKLSLSVQLSDPADYDGGELEFKATDELAPRQQGALIAFPSYLLHRVRPVTRGRRYSLVSWVSGPPFR